MTTTPEPAPAAPGYPARFIGGDTHDIANWRPLVQWLLAIPHLIITQVLEYVAGALSFVSWFIIMFTGSLPAGIASFQAMIIRYTMRANGYLLGLTEAYPPFSFDTVDRDPGDYVLGFDVQPQLTDRARVSVFFRFFLLIPLFIVAAVYGIIVLVVGTIAWFAVLFTGHYPESMRRTVVSVFDFNARLQSYATLLQDRWPPVSLSS